MAFYLLKFKSIFSKNIYILFKLLVIYLIIFSTEIAYSKNYKVENIEIIEPYNLSFKKDKVIDKAFISAFKTLTIKIISSKDLKRVETANINHIKTMIDSFSITDESFINNNYSAKFDVRFDKKKIINFLNSQNIITSIPKNQNIMFLPILIDINNNEIFIYNNNKFYRFWNNKKKQNILLNYLLPPEDLEDLKLIQKNLDNIEKFDFYTILNKYETKDYIVCIFFKDKKQLKMLSKINIDEKFSYLNMDYKNIDLNDDNKINEIITKLKMMYEDYWKSKNQINTSINLNITVSLNSKNLDKINIFESQLENSDMVFDYKILKISSLNTIYKVLYNGTPDKFINSFSENFELDISKEIWELK